MSHAEMLASEGCRVPPELESACGKLVYLYLFVRGEADVEEMAEDLGLPLITLCDLLRTLEHRGLVASDGARYHCGA